MAVNIYLIHNKNAASLAAVTMQRHTLERVMELLFATGEMTDAWEAQDIQEALASWDEK